MKYITLFSLVFLFFTGCIQNQSSNKSTQIQKIQEPTQSISTGGIFDGDLSIEGLKGPITIGLEKLTFEGLFSINIPKELHNWMYEKYIPNTTHNQNLSFWEDTHTKSMYITVETRLLEKTSTNKDICLLQTDYNGLPTDIKETTTKNINNKEIFITRITFFTEGNINPYKYTYITHFCFVDDIIMYDIVLDNWPFEYANKIIDSFSFN